MRGSTAVAAHPEASACAGTSPGLCLGGALVVFGCLVVVVRMTSQKLLSEGRGWEKKRDQNDVTLRNVHSDKP